MKLSVGGGFGLELLNEVGVGGGGHGDGQGGSGSEGDGLLGGVQMGRDHHAGGATAGLGLAGGELSPVGVGAGEGKKVVVIRGSWV